jgi:hypothetical protein
MALFSVGIQFANNDIHIFNIKALSFEHANVKIELYKFNVFGFNNDIVKSQIACKSSSNFCKYYALLKISKKKNTGYATIKKSHKLKYRSLLS